MIVIGNFFFKYRNLLFPIIVLITILIPSPLLFTEDIFGTKYYWIPLMAGVVIALLGQLIRAVTIGLKYIVRGGKNKQVYAEDLVTEGIFNHSRNPLYAGNILMVVGAGLISNSLVFIVIVVPLFCFIYQAIVLAEENYLRNKFGEQFESYCNQVNRWIPNLKGLSRTITSKRFDWRRYTRNEYNTIYLLFLAIYIFIIVFTPPLAAMNMNEKISVSVLVFGFLTGIYLFVRYLKKSKRLVKKET